MRQKKFGKKIQNWHRPLRPSQLRQRFLAHHHDDPEAGKGGRFVDAVTSVDDYWDYRDPYCECGAADCPYSRTYIEDNPEDLAGFELDQFLARVINPSDPLFRPEWATDSNTARAAPCFTEPADIGVAERLAEHIEQVVHLSKNFEVVSSRIRRAVGDFANINVLKSVGDDSRSQHFAKRVCLFAPFWIRRPETWDKSNSELLDHLFCRYEVPGFLHAEWFRPQDVPRFKWLCWFILLAQGESLKRAAKLFKWKTLGSFQHFLYHAPFDASPTEACLFAEVRRMGGSTTDFARIVRNDEVAADLGDGWMRFPGHSALVFDPTETAVDESYASFWRNTIRWLIANRDAVSDEESSRILSWAMHEYTEGQRQGARPFSWRGRRVRAVLERSVEYRRQLELPYSCYNWDGHGWNWAPDDTFLSGWSFTELTSGEELFHEGRAMRHCVSSYAGRCAAGLSAIVSVRYNDERRITVEINPVTRQVVQARGPCNRQADSEEQQAIRLWMGNVVRPDMAK